MLAGTLEQLLSANDGSEAFEWYLTTYHLQFFILLGGLFLECDGRSPEEAITLFCWVQGYHQQLRSLGVEVDTLEPSFAEASQELLRSSTVAIVDQVTSPRPPECTRD